MEPNGAYSFIIVNSDCSGDFGLGGNFGLGGDVSHPPPPLLKSYTHPFILVATHTSGLQKAPLGTGAA
jgi:hypothetical protein